MVTLEHIMAPLPVSEFIATTWQKEFLYLGAERDCYRDLMSWETLNSLLREHRLVPPRLRLYKQGIRVPSEIIQHRHPPFLLKAAELLQQLNGGATLVIDSIDETNTALLAFAQSVQTALRAPVNINLYAGWKRDNGFIMHFDLQENFILQIDGRKHWKVWTDEGTDPAAVAQTSPYWEGLLQKGQLMYIPRGWWHIATPVGEPSMHLTVTVSPLTLADLLGWIILQMKAWPGLSEPLPVFGNHTSMCDSMAIFWRELDRYRGPEIIANFVAGAPWNEPLYPQLTLPSLEA